MYLFLGVGDIKKETFTSNFYQNLLLLLSKKDVLICNFVYEPFRSWFEEIVFYNLDGNIVKTGVKYINDKTKLTAVLFDLFIENNFEDIFVFNSIWFDVLNEIGIKYNIFLDYFMPIDFTNVKKVFVLNEDDRHRFLEQGKVFVISNFYDYENCDNTIEKENKIGIFGDFFSNVNDIVKVLPFLFEYKNKDVVIVGDGDLYSFISRAVGGSIKYYYNLGIIEKLNLLASCKYVLFTNKEDGNLLWFNRALACGCNVVALYPSIYNNVVSGFDLQENKFNEKVLKVKPKNLAFSDFVSDVYKFVFGGK